MILTWTHADGSERTYRNFPIVRAVGVTAERCRKLIARHDSTNLYPPVVSLRIDDPATGTAWTYDRKAHSLRKAVPA